MCWFHIHLHHKSICWCRSHMIDHRNNCPRGTCIPWICVRWFCSQRIQAWFNQLPDDHGLEHINRICKFAGGLVGITRSDSARDRWSINTHREVTYGSWYSCHVWPKPRRWWLWYQDAGAARIFKDQNDVNSLREQFQQFHVFDYINI